MEGFHAVYLLSSLENKTLKGTYIGYTVYPGRRILQHNRFQKGGAHKTARYAPWDMVMCVHNFPTRVSGLVFEWAWQNPKASKRLKHISWNKKPNESGVQYLIRVLDVMLNTSPWKKFPLVVQWMKSEYKQPLTPPIHMPIAYGPIEDTDLDCVSRVIKFGGKCHLCENNIESDEGIYCVKRHCSFHLSCLANKWCGKEEVLPLSGKCPKCGTEQLWGEMVKLKARSSGKRKGPVKEKRVSSHWTSQLASQVQ